METPTTIFRDDARDHPVVVVIGDLDHISAPDVEDATRAAFAETVVGDVVIDVGGVTFLDSTGLGCLIALREAAIGEDRGLLLRGHSPWVDKVLRLCGLEDHFQTTDA